MDTTARKLSEDDRSELLDGRIVMMAPQTMKHKLIAENLSCIFSGLLKSFSGGVDVILTKTDRVVPDVIVVCNRDIIKRTAIHGAPDLVVEVLSRRTMKKDLGYKKDLYERCGVREYWIVNPFAYSIEIYALKDGKYELINIYTFTPEDEIEELTDEEKEELVHEFSPFIFPDLTISLAEVFDDIEF